MKTPLKIAVIFGVLGVRRSNGLAHPTFTGATCKLLNRAHAGVVFDLNTLEGSEFAAPLGSSNVRIAVCRAALSAGGS
jgi:hypothetical protein